MSRPGKSGEDTADRQAGFLERWSLRKTGARDATARDSDSTDTPAASLAVTDVDVAHVQERENVLTDSDMQPLDTLDAESDFTPFMSPGVSDELRQKALRILFRQPSSYIDDGLNDYAEDYTQFAGLGSVLTDEMKRMLQRELDAEQYRTKNASNRQQETRPGSMDASDGEPEDQEAEKSTTALTGWQGRGAGDGEEKV